MIEQTNSKNLIIMLKSILNLKGVEMLSKNEQMNINGNGPVICTKEWTPYPYYGPCIVLPPIIKVPDPLPVEPFPGGELEID